MSDALRLARYALIARRTELGLRQRDVADRLGIKQARMSQIETGRFDEIRVTKLEAWAATLGLRVRIVFEELEP